MQSKDFFKKTCFTLKVLPAAWSKMAKKKGRLSDETG